MRVIVEKNYEELSRRAALMVSGQINLQPDTVLGLATGSTPEGMYQELVAMYEQGKVDFSQVKTFNLDEYYQLPPDNPQSYHYYMQEKLFEHINIKQENIHIPEGMTDDVEQECKEYDKKIEQAGGIDLQILGIGVNGHIGFNEPAEKLNVATELVDLTQDTIEANSRFFESREDVPKKAISMGVGSILKAKRIVLLASGETKAEAIKETVSGYISNNTPSTLLQAHPDVTIIVDQKAGKLL